MDKIFILFYKNMFLCGSSYAPYVNVCVVCVVWPETFYFYFFILSIVCVYTFFCSFLYGALCPTSCQGSRAIEISIIIIQVQQNIPLIFTWQTTSKDKPYISSLFQLNFHNLTPESDLFPVASSNSGRSWLYAHTEENSDLPMIADPTIAPVPSAKE